MTKWNSCFGNSGTSSAETLDFDVSAVTDLIGLWEFTTGSDTDDTGLDDGIAQNGHYHGNASSEDGSLVLDGSCDYFDVSGSDAPFDLEAGTIQVQFTQSTHIGTSPDTIVSRGEYNDADDEGYFNIEVSASGAVVVNHTSGDESLNLCTASNFMDAGDEIRVSYSWDENGEGAFVVENVTTGETFEETFDSDGLTMDIGDSDNENFTFGARETTDGNYDHYFAGEIDYVAIYSDPSLTTASDGIVEGTDGDDTIDVDYLGDPDGDLVDNNDAILAGQSGDQDIIKAYGGDDTVIAGDDDDIVYGGAGDDNIQGNAGDDTLYGDSDGDSSANTGVAITINSQNGSYNGSLVVEVTDSEGNVSQTTLTDSYDDNIGETFTLQLDAGDTFRVGITSPEGTHWSDEDNEANNAETADGVVVTGFEDSGDSDFNDVGITTTIAGDVTMVTESGDFSGSDDNVIFSTDAGNDTIEGGKGDDTIFGEGGDDTLYGGSSSATASDNLLVNGELESGVADNTYVQTQSIEGWQSTSNLIESWGDGFGNENSQDGGNFVEIDADSGVDNIYQDVDTTDGETYTISIDAMQRVEGSDDEVEIYFGGDLIATIQPGDEWETYSFEVTGTGNTERLLISESSDDNNNYGPLIDNVSMTYETVGEDGNDTINGGDGSDTIYGGDGDDVIIGGETGTPDLGYPGLFTGDTDVDNDKDTLYGGAGNDTISGGDDDDIIDGGTGDDTINGGFDQDTISGGEGNDTIVGGEGSDTIDGGAGDDTIYGGLDPSYPDAFNIRDDAGDLVTDNGKDVIHGGSGDDTIYGADDDDYIDGGDDDDYIDGGIDDDTLIGGLGSDTILGGADEDTILVGSAEEGIGDTVDGGSTGTDYDTLDLTGSGPLNVVYTSTDQEDGYVEFLDSVGGSVTGTMTFEDIETVIPCFTPGTMIATPRGEVAVQDLKVGDKIITRDNGLQAIRWIGTKTLSADLLAAKPDLQPVSIAKGAFGSNLPERDMTVSPNHRMLVVHEKAALLFEDSEVLISAKHLTNLDGVSVKKTDEVTYIHIMCDRHEVVLSDGTWSESFQPGDYTLDGIGEESREEIFAIFPELRDDKKRGSFSAARRILKKHEAALLTS